MSLLDLLTSRISNSISSSSVPLSKISNTTFAKAGTSREDIYRGLYSTASESLRASGFTLNTAYEPINSMQAYAVATDPTNAAYYTSGAAEAQANINQQFSMSNTPNGVVKNTLSAIQSQASSAISSGVSYYQSKIGSVNGPVSTGAMAAASPVLASTQTLTNSAVGTAYNKTGLTLLNKVYDISKATIKSAVDAHTLAITRAGEVLKNLPVPAAPEVPTSDQGPKNKTSKGIHEGDAVSAIQNSTDLVYQEIRIYIEGVQVPFESASVSQSIGRLPTASFQVPPQAGLLDITRYYQPKVHIFYTDKNTGGDRLLFWGHIIACNFSRSKASASASISFECVHKNELLKQITFEWSGGMGPSLTAAGTDNQAGAQVNNFNSEASIIKALMGIDGIQSDPKDLISPKNKEVGKADPVKLATRFKDFQKRFEGMPAAIMNLWNQVKLERYSDEKLNLIFAKMFIPLLEDGVRFFDRLSGHYFLEHKIQISKAKHCSDHARPEMSKYDTMLPPAFRVDIPSAVQSTMSVNNIKSQLGFSGEFTNFHDMFINFYYGVEYEMITLASPAEVPVDPENETVFSLGDLEGWEGQDKMAVETIVKPQTPFYYSPMCNVILPNMILGLSVSQIESDIPTRVTAIGTAASQASADPHTLGVNYRAPYTIREAIAVGRNSIDGGKSSLKDTTGSSFNIPGKYEMGRGINHRKLAMPDWLAQFVKDQDSTRASNSDQSPPTDALGKKNLENLHAAWIDRYGKIIKHDGNNEWSSYTRDTTLDTLDPYSVEANIMAYERILFATADYEFTKEVVKSKTGSVECVFNPYIIPGYPMDILDSSPNNPSFHALCASVTHSISPRSVVTSVGFMAAISYTEMYNYYMQPLHPWLQNALSLINVSRNAGTSDPATDKVITKDPNLVPTYPDSLFVSEDTFAANKESQQNVLSDSHGITPDAKFDANNGSISKVVQGLIDNPRAKEAADRFYSSVLGVGCADPSQIFDFSKGNAKPILREGGTWIDGSGSSHINELNGGELNDNLTVVGNLRLITRPIEGKKSIENKFEIKFIDLVARNYNLTTISYVNKIVSSPDLLEPGASMFLDYPNVSDILKGV